MRNVLNIINFIRAVEPRPGRNIDLLEPVFRQMELARKYRLPVTWLLQYDALIKADITDFLRTNMEDTHEVGAWFEVVQPMAEAAGIDWQGRYPWDWHVDKGFSLGYTPSEREKLADVFMDQFMEVWGYYPASVGSWLMDAHLIAYLHEKYHIVASCNCRDQWGTDGYTLWGGYWANAYYPSRCNSYMLASSLDQQIPVPVFRMLGSDPIYQYDAPIGGNGQSVITLEPVSKGDGTICYGGDDPAWTEWFLDTTFSSPSLAMSYAQAGQENSFGWPVMKKGIEFQFSSIAVRARQGQFMVETLRESGRNFKADHRLTPVTAVTALDDWKKERRASIWYLSRFQRLNFFVEDRILMIRDWQLFDENYQEPHLEEVCRSSSCVYDALPIMDGMRWRGKQRRAGIKFCIEKEGKIDVSGGEIDSVTECGEEALEMVWKWEEGIASVLLKPGSVAVSFQMEPGVKGVLLFDIPEEMMTVSSFSALCGNTGMSFCHNRMRYDLKCRSGSFQRCGEGVAIFPDRSGCLVLEAGE